MPAPADGRTAMPVSSGAAPAAVLRAASACLCATLAVLCAGTRALSAAERGGGAGSGGAGPEAPKNLDDALLLPSDRLDLGRAALLLSVEYDRRVDVEACLRKLSDMAAEAAPSVAGAASPAAPAGKGRAALDALCAYLFERRGFGLPERDDPESFLLHSVLERKRGNCLGLSMLFLTLCERLKLPVFAVALPSRDAGPGHVIVAYSEGGIEVFADLTRRGLGATREQYIAEYSLSEKDLAGGCWLRPLDKRLVLHMLMVNLAGGLVEAGRWKEAASLLERARKVKEDHPGLWNNMGNARFAGRDMAGAEEAFRKALALDGRMVAARVGLGSVALARGEAEAAEREYRAAVEACERCAEAHRGLGAALARRGAMEEAAAALKRASGLKPRDPAFARDLGTVLLRAGRMEGAREALERARELDPRDGLTLVALARLSLSSGDRPAAMALAEDAAADEKARAEAFCLLGELKIADGDFSGAAALFEKSLAADPDHAQTLYGMARAERRLGRAAAAKSRLERAARIAPWMREIHTLLGDICADSKDWAGAIAAYSRALQADPADSATRYRLCACYMKSGRQESAIAIAKWCIEKDPADPAAWQILGGAYENLGRKKEALDAWKRANELAPGLPAVMEALKRLEGAGGR
ncbi:MAG: tetratricopeptide repeat protein [Planctomycetota bacterium]|nr:tetratricopeptide repeat protein [Planctomycetota bacterium]